MIDMPIYFRCEDDGMLDAMAFVGGARFEERISIEVRG